MTGDTERKLRGGVGDGVLVVNMLAAELQPSSSRLPTFVSPTPIFLALAVIQKCSWSQVVSLTVVSKQLHVTVNTHSQYKGANDVAHHYLYDTNDNQT